MGSPVLSLLHAIDQPLCEVVEDGALHQDALHRDAGLPAVGKAADNAAMRRVREVGIADGR